MHQALLDDIVRQYRDLIQSGQDLLAGLSNPQVAWRPEGGGWSVGECLQHLNVTAELYVPAIRAAVDSASPTATPAGRPFRPGFIWRRILRWVEPPPKSKAKAPAKFAVVAASLPPTDELLKNFVGRRNELIELVERSGKLDLRRTKVVSPVSRFLRIGLGNTYLFLAGHDRRHLWQARRVTEAPGFPKETEPR